MKRRKKTSYITKSFDWSKNEPNHNQNWKKIKIESQKFVFFFLKWQILFTSSVCKTHDNSRIKKRKTYKGAAHTRNIQTQGFKQWGWSILAWGKHTPASLPNDPKSTCHNNKQQEQHRNPANTQWECQKQRAPKTEKLFTKVSHTKNARRHSAAQKRPLRAPNQTHSHS